MRSISLKALIIFVIFTGLTTACIMPSSERFDSNLNSAVLTATPTPFPTSTNTPAPTPTLTPIPAARVDFGDLSVFYGDYDRAEQEFRIALDSENNEEIRSAAQMGLAKVFYLKGETYRALEELRQFIEQFPASPHLPEAYYYLGKVYTELDRFDDAATAYQSYLETNPGVIDSYIEEFRGDSLYASGNYPEALEAYINAANSSRVSDRFELLKKLALSYRINLEAETAVVIYQDLFDHTVDDFQKAQLLFLLGQTYLELGLTEEAYTRFLESVEKYPLSFDSYNALVSLVNNGIAVSDFDRGLVDYYAGEYSLAVSAFDRYINSAPDDFNSEASTFYFRGLAKRALGTPTNAIEDWDKVIENYIGSERWADAWEQKGFTQWAYLDMYSEAVETFLNFAEQAPDHPQAPEFLGFAARVSERDQALERAAQIWDQINIEYPNNPKIYESSFLAGITYFRLGEFEAARTAFERALNQSINPQQRAASLLWIGKTQQALGNNLEATNVWQQAAFIDPTGYYSERASELLAGESPFSAPLAYDFSYEIDVEKSDADNWVRTKFNVEPDVDLNSLGELASDPRLIRGSALWKLENYNEARAEFEDLRKSVENDPVNTYRLAQYFIDIGLFRPGIIAARQVLDLAGLDDAGTLKAPKYFNRIRFGPYFGELIIPAAHENQFHPLFVFSVARQESLFEGFVRSFAGARGVMQIIPSTGQSIVNRIGWPPNYDDLDLYRPYINITLGANYLGQQRDLFEDNLYAALAAYNAGPGNAEIWAELAGDDPDLLLEIIRFGETQQYIRSIFEIYKIYYSLYDRSP